MSKSENKQSCLPICLGGSVGLVIATACICYIVFGILFLVQDYNIWNDCGGSALWPYVLVSIILSLNRGNMKDLDNTEKIAVMICAILIEFCMSIWGGIELFDKSDGCSELTNSNLWKFGLVTFIFQILVVSIVLLIVLILPIVNYYNKPRKSEELEPNPVPISENSNAIFDYNTNISEV